MKEIIMELEDLSCPVCAQKVNDALKNVTGVENVDVSFKTGRAKVKFDPDRQSQDEIKKLVEKLGYGVKSIK
ncbi:MAG: heavy-metal-associated domain-containing protein [Desulfotomaculaceae bacterium]